MLFDRIRQELGNPNLYQVSREQFEQMENCAREKRGRKPIMVSDLWGCASEYYPHIYISSGMAQKRRTNCIYHEALHLLYPTKRHWWITLAARRLAGGGHGEDGTRLYGHTLDEIQPRARLVVLARRASKRFNESSTTRRKGSA